MTASERIKGEVGASLVSGRIERLRGNAMCVEGRIDRLIKAGWYVLDSGFDHRALAHWRREARDCVAALVGPDHECTRHFRDSVESTEETDL
jgi:hypothetical protein